MKIFILAFLTLVGIFCRPALVSEGTGNDHVPDDLNTPATEASLGKGYFKAKGQDPAWSLNISDDRIAFESERPGFETFQFPHVEPVKAMDANVKMYRVQTEHGQLEMDITSSPCQISNSHEGFSYTVKVALRRSTDTTFTVFNGCGTYITDSRLQSKWVLEQIKDKPLVLPDTMTSSPMLDIRANGNSFSGFAGCNQISGRLFSERTLLRFTDVVSTKMACDASTIETAFLQALSFSTQFKIEDNHLILSNPGGTTLILRKAE